jgi:hypothetical protein
MSDSTVTEPSGNPTSFASLLASLAGAGRKPADTWDISELADDVATISYEQALRSHRRVRAAEPIAVTPVLSESQSGEPSARSDSKKIRRTSSITIRVTENEQIQLQARAVEAGLSVSAYLRSCIFEAESLRAQVKEALSQMRAATEKVPDASTEASTPSATRRRFHFLPQWPHKREAQD